jgi:glycosyltransferase involved in cell wall biosynthesis
LTLTLGLDASVVSSSSGGTRTYALQLLRHLLEIRPEWSLVLYLRDASEAGRLGLIAGAANVRTHAVRGRPNAWRVQALLPAQLDRDRVDVYHSMGYFLPLRWAGPKVVTVHDLNVYTQVRSWLRPETVLRWADLAIQTPLSVRAADRVITDSEFSRREIERRIGAARGKVVVIPLAADAYFGETPSLAESEQAKAIAHGQPYLLFVGILSPMKNLTTLLRAYASSTLPVHGVRLVLAGSNREGYAAALHDEARSIGIAGQVDFPGFVPDPTLRALYWNAMAVVLPSHGEGFGLPLVEAMAAGTPILAADSQSIPEVLGSAGRLFEPHDTHELAGLLSRLADDATFRRDLVEATRASRDRYSWRKTAEATAAVYEEVLAARRR